MNFELDLKFMFHLGLNDTVEGLIACGEDVNMKDKTSEETLLHKAAENGTEGLILSFLPIDKKSSLNALRKKRK